MMPAVEAWGERGQVKAPPALSFFTQSDDDDDDDDDDDLSNDLKAINKESSVLEVVKFMALSTTAHGPKHAWTMRGTWVGYFWLFITVLLSFSLIYAIVHHCSDFFSREIKSQSSLQVNSMGLQLPSMVSCNRDFFSRTKLAELNITRNFTSYLMAVAGLPVMLRKEMYETEEGRRFLNESHHALNALLQERNETFTELVDFLSIKCEETVLVCRFASIHVGPEECCRDVVRVTTTLGRCYILYLGDNVTQVLSGENEGLTFVLRDLSDLRPDINTSILDVFAMGKMGLQITFISRITMPMWRVLGEGTMIRPGTLTAIEVFLTKIDRKGLKTIVDVTEPSCVTTSDLISSRNIGDIFRSSTNCYMMKCYRCLSTFCPNCTFPTYRDLEPGNNEKKMCDMPMSLHCYKSFYSLWNENHPQYPQMEAARAACIDIFKMKCLPVCEEDTFHSKKRVHKLTPVLQDKISQNVGLPKGSNVSVVMVYYPNFLHGRLLLTRTTFLDFFSELGGSMGLILGASFITFLEGIVFGSLSFIAVLRKLLCR